jgi:hypothetical protein
MAIDPAGAAIGVAGLLGLVGTCIQTIEFGFVMKDRKDQVKFLRGQLDIEALLLRRWAENVLMVRDGAVDTIPVVPASYCAAINNTLDQMLDLFKESSGLVSKYRDDKAQESLCLIQRQTQAHRRLFDLISVKNIKRPGAFRWAIRDASKLITMVYNIQTYRKQLQELLPPDLELLKLQILIDTVATSTPDNIEMIGRAATEISLRNPGDAQAMDSVRAAVAIRQQLPEWRLRADNAQAIAQRLFISKPQFRPSNIPSDLTPWYTSLSSDSPNIHTQDVMVEWRCSEPGIEKFVFERDVIQLANLLTSLINHPDAHLPRCLGYIKDEKFHLGFRYGLVLSIPMPIHPPATPQSRISLYDEIGRKKYPYPDLSIRFRLASDLATSIFHLMSSCWLHKGIRSSNIHLLKAPDSKSTLQDASFVLVGFEFSRLDEPGQVSRNAKDTAALDLYRHPNAVSSKWKTEEYKKKGYIKQYDIYSLGVVLAEIGLWLTTTVLSEKAKNYGFGNERFAEFLKERVRSEIPGMMGGKFRAVVDWCLSGMEGEDDPGKDAVEVLEEFEDKVLRTLRDCKV